MVTREDAANLAKGIETALDDIPEISFKDKQLTLSPSDMTQEDMENPKAAIFAKLSEQLEKDQSVTTANFRLHPFEYWAGDGKGNLREFIEFSREGPFWIY